MVFMPDRVPDKALDPTDEFIADTPFDNKQTTITTRRHRWFVPYPIVAANTNPANGLAAGATCRIEFTHKPDFIQVSISGQTAATGRCTVFMGEPGGVGIGPCGGGAKITMPAPQGGIITVVNIGSTPTVGMVTAIGGYTDPGIDITLGS